MPISAPPLPISWEIVTIAIAPSFPACARGARAGPNRSDGGESVVCLLHLVKVRLDKVEQAGAQSAALSADSRHEGAVVPKEHSATVRRQASGLPKETRRWPSSRQ